MELAEAEDMDKICEVFSQEAKENTDHLSEQVQELVKFLKDRAVSWEFTGAYSTGGSSYGSYAETRSATYSIQTDGGIYTCCIRDVPKDSDNTNVVGFSSVSIYPTGLDIEYGSSGKFGCSVVYRVGPDTEDVLISPSSMETLMEMAEQKDADRIREAFFPTVRENTDGLEERISELIGFLNNTVISWEPYTWEQSEQYMNGVKVNQRTMFFYLHTDSGLYRCDIRDVPKTEDQEVNTGILSISVFPALFPEQTPELDDAYEGYCIWSRENTGISIVYGGQV